MLTDMPANSQQQTPHRQQNVWAYSTIASNPPGHEGTRYPLCASARHPWRARAHTFVRACVCALLSDSSVHHSDPLHVMHARARASVHALREASPETLCVCLCAHPVAECLCETFVRASARAELGVGPGCVRASTLERRVPARVFAGMLGSDLHLARRRRRVQIGLSDWQILIPPARRGSGAFKCRRTPGAQRMRFKLGGVRGKGL